VATTNVIGSGAFSATGIERGTRERLLAVNAALDFTCSAAALAIAAAEGWLDRPANALAVTTTVVLIAAIVVARRSLGRLRSGLFDDLSTLMSAAALGVAAGFIVQVLAAARPYPSGAGLLGVAAVDLTSLIAARAFFAVYRNRTVPALPTLIVGAGTVGRLVAQRLIDQPRLGLEPIGFLDKDPRIDQLQPGRSVPVLGASWDLERVVLEHQVGYVIFTFSTAPTEVLLGLVRRCEDLGLHVALVPRLFETVPRRVGVHHLGGVPLLQLNPSNPKGFSFAVKHALDRVLAALLIPVFAPALMISALAVAVSLGRPIFFRQRRIGQDGRPFEMLKFRTMANPPVADDAGEQRCAEQNDAAAFSGLAPGGIEGADRRTRVGVILRRTSLDELPQLFNVLKGEMSFIGPRPERPEFVSMFSNDVYRYGDRHRVKSGITGWSQVNGLRGRTSIHDRAEWDNYYIENWSFSMDLRIVALTFRTLLWPGAAE
jgi:exopolysaccharide biosynthesis polyprenyl glycosylphosphotransferase